MVNSEPIEECIFSEGGGIQESMFVTIMHSYFYLYILASDERSESKV